MSDVPLGPNVGEWSVEALISGTLYVFLDLRKALVRGVNFQDVLLSGFAKKLFPVCQIVQSCSAKF